ncbi:hypothetical protein TNCV_3713931 [Trichonephila clavipes]|nr:hypothetical protein TNCV_3713931 [Trichonephila clavipes]
MTTVDFLHHENPPTWAGVEPATLGVDGQRQTNYATQSALAEFSCLMHKLFQRIESEKRKQLLTISSWLTISVSIRKPIPLWNRISNPLDQRYSAYRSTLDTNIGGRAER